MATQKQRAAARRNIKKAAAAANENKLESLTKENASSARAGSRQGQADAAQQPLRTAAVEELALRLLDGRTIEV